jgi:hypothetical protein
MRQQVRRWNLGLIVLAAASCNFPSLSPLAGGGEGEPDGGNDPDGDPTSDDRPDPVEPGLFSLELLAGDVGGIGYVDGVGAAARFNRARGVAADGDGNVYVADTDNHTIRKIAPEGTTTTLAGRSGVSGSADGGSDSRFRVPQGVAVDQGGNVYVADAGNHTIRKINPDGVVITLAGNAGQGGSADGAGADARFAYPTGVAVDSAGDVYVADSGNFTIRKVTASGVVTTLAGCAGIDGSADGIGVEARFGQHQLGVAVDGAGTIYVADAGNHTIRKVTAAGAVTTLAGTAGMPGTADGTGAAARFEWPNGVTVDSAGNVYVADGFTIRKITAAGRVTTLAGAREYGSADGTGGAARFFVSTGVAVDGTGNVYVADSENHAIRKVTAEGVVTTLAGHASAEGNADGTGAEARFLFPGDVAVDSTGTLYVTDNGNYTIRRITTAGEVTTLARTHSYPTGIAVDSARGNVYVTENLNYTLGKVVTGGVAPLAGSGGVSGHLDGERGAARFSSPMGTALDGAGNIYVADYLTIRKVTPDGVVTTLAGDPGSAGSEDDTGAAARFAGISSVAVDSVGTVYVADTVNLTIRKVTAGRVVTTLAGTVQIEGRADGRGASARFARPRDVALDSAGNLYVADAWNATIRKVTPDGTVTTIAGRAGVHQITLGDTPGFASPHALVVVGDSIVVVDHNAVLLLRPRAAVTAR